ncbi:MAG: acyl carrier protein phosphodiesterase [Paraglaciecola sp.]|jgi:acyl carrier protein phosphodiesterase
MNYIAHLHLAKATQTSLVGNFLGDFVKGSHLQHLPGEIQTGIKLHRKIDVLTDNHPQVVKLRTLFPPHIRRVAGIVLDVYFDYLLMCHWPQFCDQHHSILFSHFYRELGSCKHTGNEHFQHVRQGLISHRWLADYQYEGACLRALKTIEHRLNHKIVFAEAAMVYLRSHHQEIQQSFLQFYPDLLKQTRDFASKL